MIEVFRLVEQEEGMFGGEEGLMDGFLSFVLCSWWLWFNN